MKHIYLLLLLFCSVNIVYSQNNLPEGINYQAVVYDEGNQNPGLDAKDFILRNQEVSVRFSIIETTVNGNEVFQETHATKTDNFGLFSIVIGKGTQISSNAFSAIAWGKTAHFLKVEIDKKGGNSYLDMGIQELWSVPYSLSTKYAENAGNGITGVSDNGDGTMTFDYQNGSKYITPKLVGLTGPKGESGTNGINGTQGIQGLKGDTGLTGIQGLKGDIGDKGDIGLSGTQGIQGIRGLKGDTGTQGSQGIQGLKGDTGTQGSQGIQGLKGDTGDKGDTGLTGAKGDAGTQGIQGIQGLKGDTGAQGGDLNIYNADGTLTSNRTISIESKNLIIDGTGKTIINGTTVLNGPIYTTKYRESLDATINSDDLYIGVKNSGTVYTLPLPTTLQTGHLLVFVDLTGGAGFTIMGAEATSVSAPTVGGGSLTYLCTGSSWVCINGF